MTQLTNDEALRVVGHLLEHHPTIYSAARNARAEATSTLDPEATCYCLTGALSLVEDRFRLPPYSLFAPAMRLLLDPGIPTTASELARHWDTHGAAWRSNAVEKLKRAGL